MWACGETAKPLALPALSGWTGCGPGSSKKELGGLSRPLLAGPRVVVGDEILLGWTFGLRHVLQVHPYPVPERAGPAHSVHQDIGGLKGRYDAGVPGLPFIERRECFRLCPGPGYFD